MVSAHFPLGPKARTEEDSLPRTNGEGPNGLEVRSRMTLSSASYGPKGKSNTSSKVTSKALPEEKASGMGLALGCSVGMDQGKDVTSTLNASTNFLATLIGKDP